MRNALYFWRKCVHDCSFWQYKLFVDIYSKAFLGDLSSNRSGLVEVDEFAVFPSSCVSEISSTLLSIAPTTISRSGLLLTPIRMTLNDHGPRMPIQLKVRLVEGMLEFDVHIVYRYRYMLWLSEPTMRD